MCVECHSSILHIVSTWRRLLSPTPTSGQSHRFALLACPLVSSPVTTLWLRAAHPISVPQRWRGLRRVLSLPSLGSLSSPPSTYRQSASVHKPFTTGTLFAPLVLSCTEAPACCSGPTSPVPAFPAVSVPPSLLAHEAFTCCWPVGAWCCSTCPSPADLN